MSSRTPMLRMPDGTERSLGAPIVVGRDPTPPPIALEAIPLAIRGDLSVSKTHALIEWKQGQLWVTDLHSSNGAEVVSPDGRVKLLVPDVATVVQVTDRVQVGSSTAIEFLSAVVARASPPLPPVARSVVDLPPAMPIAAPIESVLSAFAPTPQVFQPISVREFASPDVPVPQSAPPAMPVGDLAEPSDPSTEEDRLILRRRVGMGLVCLWSVIGLYLSQARSFEAAFGRAPLSTVFLLTIAGLSGWVAVAPPGEERKRIVTLVLSSVFGLFVVLTVLVNWGATQAFVVFLVTLSLPGCGFVLFLTEPTARAEATGADRGTSVGPGQRPTLPVVPLDLGTRIGAYVIDGVLVVVTLGIGWFIWSILLWKDGQSPGKKMVGAVVVDRSTGQVADAGTMAVRELLGKGLLGFITLGITGVISVFMVLLGREHRAVHDNVAGTVVVSASRPNSSIAAPPVPW